MSVEHHGRGGTDVTVPLSTPVGHRGYADVRIRAVRDRPRQPGEEAPHIALSASERAELGRLAQIIDFRTAGSPQGGDANFVYLLTAGLVRICHSLHNGERQVVAFHWPGDLFGLTEEAKYVNSAETVTPARVYRFQAAKLESFLLKNPKIQNRFLIKAMHDLRHAQRQIIVMGRFDIPRRLGIFQRWPAKFGQADKWKICLRAARMPPIRSDNGKTRTTDAQSGFQGEGGTGCHQGREDAGRAGAAV
jgi:CRP-like cAMP-binding protein